MYTIKDFANIIGVTPQTLRNKHKNGQIVPTLVNPDNNYRMYSDELAYRHNENKYIVAYTSCSLEEKEKIALFEKKLKSLNIKYKLFFNNQRPLDLQGNEALKNILKEASEGNTYTVLYDDTVDFTDLNLIKFYLNSCFSNIQIKNIDDFSLENMNIDNKGE